MRASYTFKDLKRYQLSLQAMRSLGWVSLAGVIWLGITVIVRHVQLPYVLAYPIYALTGLWTAVGWVILVLFALLLAVTCYFRGLYPTLIKYLQSSPTTTEFLDWLRAGVVETSEKGDVKVQNSKSLEGFIAFLDKDTVLVVVFVPKGVGGKGVVDNATAAVKEYADSVLIGLRSGAVQRTAGARYWIYRRAK